MILGILSVTMATSQQQAVGQLNDALTVRLWVSRGRPTRYFTEFLDVAERFFPDRHADPRNENKYHRSVFEELPLESSMTSLKIVALRSQAPSGLSCHLIRHRLRVVRLLSLVEQHRSIRYCIPQYLHCLHHHCRTVHDLLHSVAILQDRE